MNDEKKKGISVYPRLIAGLSGLFIIAGLAISAIAAGVVVKILLKLFFLGFNLIGGAI